MFVLLRIFLVHDFLFILKNHACDKKKHVFGAKKKIHE
jgi:hypothetical protein